MKKLAVTIVSRMFRQQVQKQTIEDYIWADERSHETQIIIKEISKANVVTFIGKLIYPHLEIPHETIDQPPFFRDERRETATKTVFIDDESDSVEDDSTIVREDGTKTMERTEDDAVRGDTAIPRHPETTKVDAPETLDMIDKIVNTERLTDPLIEAPIKTPRQIQMNMMSYFRQMRYEGNQSKLGRVFDIDSDWQHKPEPWADNR